MCVSWIAVSAAGNVHAGDCCRIEMEHVVFEAFEVDGKFGFRLKDADFVLIEPRYVFATTFTPEGIAAVVDGDGWAWIDRNGTVLARPHVVDNGPDRFSGGLTRIVDDGRIGFMDERGQVVVAARFAYAEPVRGGYALICEDCRSIADGEHTAMSGSRWGVIDASGEIAVAPGPARDTADRRAEDLRSGE